MTELPKKRVGSYTADYSLAKLAFHVILMYLAINFMNGHSAGKGTADAISLQVNTLLLTSRRV